MIIKNKKKEVNKQDRTIEVNVKKVTASSVTDTSDEKVKEEWESKRGRT